MNQGPNIQNWPRKDTGVLSEAFKKMTPLDQRIFLIHVADALKQWASKTTDKETKNVQDRNRPEDA